MHRTKPHKHVLRSIINKKLKQPKTRLHTDTGLVEDRHNSTAIVRVVVGLLLVHLIVIGGVILRGKIKSGEGTAIAAPTITAPPTQPVANQPVQNDVLPQPVDGPVANPVRTPEQPTHITQATETTTAPAVSEPEIVTPVVADAAPATPAPAADAPVAADAPCIKHLVVSGETLYGIAAKHQTSVEAIRKANPQLRNNNIVSGTHLNIPVKADSAEGRQIAALNAEAAATEAAKSYTIQRGDTLAKIARKHKTTVPRLMELNNIPKGKEGSIRVGATLIISQ